MPHANAPLSPTGRLRLARCVVDQGWPLRRAADRFGVSVTCAHRWATRYRQHGPAGMVDRSSRPRSCPHRTTWRLERRVLGLRVSRRWGPARIAYHLGLNISTVGRILARYGCPRLTFTDPATGTRIRRTRPTRYEREAPGDLVHVDIKKLGRIPDGGGHKALGRAAGGRNSHAHQDPTRPRRKDVSGGRPNLGYVYLHHAVDDYSRLAYSEMLPDETKKTASAFMTRALKHFQDRGITVVRVLTDNGACYRSRDFAAVLQAAGVKHKRTRPYRPQTNGKVERFNRTLQEEWAYAHPYTSESQRAAAYPEFLHRYNHHRPHTALKGASPADRVTNLPGQYSAGLEQGQVVFLLAAAPVSVALSGLLAANVAGDAAVLQDSGVRARATVEKSSWSAGQWLDVRFSLPDGTVMRTDVTPHGRVYYEGDTLEVVYQADAPRNVQVVGDASWQVQAQIAVAVFVVCAVGSAVVVPVAAVDLVQRTRRARTALAPGDSPAAD